MLAISRLLIRQVRAVFRRCLAKNGPTSQIVVVCEGQAKGLCVRFYSSDVLVDYRQPGTFATETIALPLEALADFEGRDPSLVELDLASTESVRASWIQEGIPQAREYPLPPPDRVVPFPPLPSKWTPQPRELLPAWREAIRCTATESVRYALQRLLLRGQGGQLIATDGKQLLVQAGFRFPWNEDLLVPRLDALDPKLLGGDGPVALGKTEQHVLLRVGPWTFCLKIDTAARFPQVEQVIPNVAKARTRWRLDPDDSGVLANALPHLPGREEENKSVTVDLNGQVLVRAQGEDGPPTEIVLARSEAQGQPVRFCVQRDFLRRALQLGFREAFVVSPDTPLLFQDDQRKYVVMPLGKDGVIAPSPEAIRTLTTETAFVAPRSKSRPVAAAALAAVSLDSDPESRPTLPTVPHERACRSVVPVLDRSPDPLRKRAEHAMAVIPPMDPGADKPGSNGVSADRLSIDALVAEAEGLRCLLVEACGRASQLLTALKHEKRQSKALRAAVASLRQLQLGP